MALKTVNITGKLYNPDGTPAANATGTAVLTRLEVDDGTVVPSVVSFTTDAAGLLDINLWPNERGQAGSRYRLRAKTAKNGIVDTMITVPDSDAPVSLDDVIEAVPYPPVEYSKKILEQAQTAAGLAVDAQTDIHTNWQGKLDIAAQQAETATIQAGIATDKADEAAGSAATANAAKTAAELARDAAMVGAVTYPDEATGRAAVADGEYFKVIGSGDVAAREYQRTNASTSVLVAEYPSVDAIQQGKESFLNTFDTFAQLEASSLDRYVFAAVVNDPDLSKNGFYQKNANYEWYRVRLNSEIEIREFLSKKGFAQIYLVQPSNANYSTLDKTLTISGGAFVVTNRGVYTLSTPITLSFPENRVYHLAFNEGTNTLKLGSYAEIEEDGWLYCGTINKVWNGLSTSVFKDFLIDGVAQPSILDLAERDTVKADLQTLNLIIDPVARTMQLPFTINVFTDKTRISAAAQTFNFSETDGIKYVMFEKATKLLSSVNQGQSITLMNAKTHYLLFMYDPVNQTTAGYTGKYTVVGKKDDFSRGNYVLALTRPGGLNFDFNNNKIVLSEAIWIPYDGFRLSVPAQEIALDPERNKGFRTLIYVNPSNSSIVLGSSAAGSPSIPKDHVLIGVYQENLKLFYGLRYFSVNGEPFEENKEKIKPVFGWDVNTKLEVDVSDSFTVNDTLDLVSIKTADVYAWYDALVAAYPEYVTKTVLGRDSSDLFDVNMYRFNPKRVGTDGRLDTKIPKVMMLALHNEAINFVYPYMLLREICNSWQGNEALTAMRHGLEFVVIPVLNPWGLDNGKRKNFNQVNLNTNFPIGWTDRTTIESTSYQGPYPASEVETQYAYATMVAERPDIYFDCHSYGSWNNNGRSVWQPVLNDKTRVAAMSTASKVYSQYKQKYNWLTDLDELVHLTDSTITGSGLSSKSGESVGAVGGTLEIAWNLKDEPSGLTGHNSVINFATDYLGTSILQALSVIISSK